MARLLEKYRTQVIPRLAEQLGQKNAYALPRLQKIVVNMGVGSATQDRKRLEEATGHLATITGQRPLVTKAKKAISAFRLREGMEIGCKVTLRGLRMYEFLDRLVSLALPRVRDFRGLNPRAFDGNGNYSLGLTEQLVFPEIEADKVNFTQGMHITLVTTATSNEAARLLLKELGMPFTAE
ncbi:MAG: 50S ribosomal protein L5 [Planctomycetaceae bacterium]|nr:MAG: 50S ribosomal protein L5 [Planctomycetaceae bacterium]